MKNNFVRFLILILIGGVLLNPAFAEESSAGSDDIKALREEIQMLRERVNELEGQQKAESLNPQGRSSTLRGPSAADPFEEMRRIQNEMRNMFSGSFGSGGMDPFAGGLGAGVGGSFGGLAQQGIDFDLDETDDGYRVVFNTEGMDQDELEIEINTNSITVSGKTSSQVEQEEEGAVMHSQSYGSFLRTIPLPVDADTARAETRKEDGQLVIQIPRKK